MELNKLTKEDTSIIESVSQKFFNKPALYAKTFLDNPYLLGYIIRQDDEIIGCLFGYILPMFTSKGKAFIYSVDVCHSHRKKGYGKRLVMAFLDEAKKQGIAKVFVMTNTHNQAAIRLYKSTHATSSLTDACLLEWEL